MGFKLGRQDKKKILGISCFIYIYIYIYIYIFWNISFFPSYKEMRRRVSSRLKKYPFLSKISFCSHAAEAILFVDLKKKKNCEA